MGIDPFVVQLHIHSFIHSSGHPSIHPSIKSNRTSNIEHRASIVALRPSPFVLHVDCDSIPSLLFNSPIQTRLYINLLNEFNPRFPRPSFSSPGTNTNPFQRLTRNLKRNHNYLNLKIINIWCGPPKSNPPITQVPRIRFNFASNNLLQRYQGRRTGDLRLRLCIKHFRI